MRGRASVGFNVRDALAVSEMMNARVLAGSKGLDRPIRWVHILDIPDIVPWVSEHDLVLTNGYGFATHPESMAHLIERLDDKGVSGLIVGLGLFLHELPSSMVEEAEKRSFPLIEISWRVRFEDLTLQVIQGILGTQSQLLERVQLASQGLVEAALSAGFDQMADRLAEALQQPAVVLDRWGKAIAGSTDSFLRSARRHQEPLKERLDECVGQLEECTSGIEVPLGRRRASMYPMLAGDRIMGAILLGSEAPLGPSEQMIMAVASTVVALELIRLEESFESARARRQEFLGDLIRGSLRSSSSVEARAEFLGWPVGCTFVLAVLDVDGFEERFRDAHQGEAALAEARKNMLDKASRHVPGPEVFVAEQSGSLTALLEANSVEEAAKVLEPLRLALRSLFDEITVGLAGPSESLQEVQHLHGQAWQAIRIGRKLGRAGEVISFDDIRVEHLLLRLEDRESGALHLVPELQSVLEYDRRHRGELFKTLEMYLHAWGNTEFLARELHIHRNTARYRIRKIEQLLGKSLVDPEYRFALHVATKLVHLES